MQKAFNQMKALMTADLLCAYPDHNKPFHIFTDVSNHQVGACIMQEAKPVAYYSKKLNSAQMTYRTINEELLCVVATLCKFHSMLFGENYMFTQTTKPFSASRLGILILGSNFWDPHWKRNSGSISDSKDSGRIFFEILISGESENWNSDL